MTLSWNSTTIFLMVVSRFMTRWWFQISFLNVYPQNWGRFPILTHIFSNGLKPPTRWNYVFLMKLKTWTRWRSWMTYFCSKNDGRGVMGNGSWFIFQAPFFHFNDWRGKYPLSLYAYMDPIPSYTIHVWHVYLHLVDVYVFSCTEIFQSHGW